MQNFDYTSFTRKITFSEKLRVKHVPLAVFGIIVSSILLLLGFIAALPIFLSEEVFVSCLLVGTMVMTPSLIAYHSADGKIRFSEFASRNGAVYVSDHPYDERPGMIFGFGDSKKFIDFVSYPKGPITETGVYKCSTGSGKSRQNHYFSFVRVKLPRNLPNMILDSKQNNSFGGRLSNLPHGFSRDQQLVLEGDFGSYYNLYVPEQYHRDALYIFTPDVMHALVDATNTYDCEVIDDDFYIFSKTTTRPRKLEIIQEMVAISSRVGHQIGEQADNYADERVGDRSKNVIAEHGARIKTGIPPAIIATAAIGVLLLIGQLLDMLI